MLWFKFDIALSESSFRLWYVAFLKIIVLKCVNQISNYQNVDINEEEKVVENYEQNLIWEVWSPRQKQVTFMKKHS